MRCPLSFSFSNNHASALKCHGLLQFFYFIKSEKVIGGALNILKEALQVVSSGIRKSNKDYQKTYRAKKNAADDSFRKAENNRKRKERAAWTQDQVERNREQSKLRQRLYRYQHLPYLSFFFLILCSPKIIV